MVTAYVNSAGALRVYSNNFPILLRVDIERWVFFVTVAGVFMAATRLTNLKLPATREDALMERVAEKLAKWDSRGMDAFQDCKRVFDLEYDRLEALNWEPRFLASDAVGAWIGLNILQHKARDIEESKLFRATGVLVVHSFFNWWDA